MRYNSEIAGKVFEKYYWTRENGPNRKITVSP